MKSLHFTINPNDKSRGASRAHKTTAPSSGKLGKGAKGINAFIQKKFPEIHRSEITAFDYTSKKMKDERHVSPDSAGSESGQVMAQYNQHVGGE